MAIFTEGIESAKFALEGPHSFAAIYQISKTNF